MACSLSAVSINGSCQLSSCVSSSSDLTHEREDKDLGLLGRDGSCEDEQTGVLGGSTDAEDCIDCDLKASLRNSSMLFGLIVDRRRLPSLREPLPGDDFAPATSSRVSFSVRTGEASLDKETAELRRSSSDSEARKKVVGPEFLELAA